MENKMLNKKKNPVKTMSRITPLSSQTKEENQLR